MSKKEMELIEQRFEQVCKQIGDLSSMVRLLTDRVESLESRGAPPVERTPKIATVPSWYHTGTLRLGQHNG